MKALLTKPQAVIFDIGNVLMSWTPEAFYERTLGPERARLFFAQVPIVAMNEGIDRGAPFEGSVRALAQNHPAWSAEIMLWHDSWLEMTKPWFPQSIALRDKLREKGIATFALTNFGSESYDKFQSDLPFLTQFDRSFVSGKLGVMKPEQRIYEIVEEETGLAPNAILFTDDRADNIMAAARRGWRTHQFESWQGLAQRLVAEELLTKEEAGL